MVDCMHCGDRIEDRGISVQPFTFQSDGQLEYENMAWRVHIDCVDSFVDECDAL